MPNHPEPGHKHRTSTYPSHAQDRRSSKNYDDTGLAGTFHFQGVVLGFLEPPALAVAAGCEDASGCDVEGLDEK
jgi:hypothetical protein